MENKKNRSVWNVITAAVCALLLAAEALAVFQIWRLDMLPIKYFLILLAVLAVVDLLLGLLLRPEKTGKWQKKQGHGRQVTGCILAGLMIIGCLLGTSVISKVNEAMSFITGSETVSVLMDVYVRAEDPAQSVSDAGSYTFGIALATGDDANQAAVESIEQQLSQEITVLEYDTVFALVDALYAAEVDAIIMDSAYLGVLDSLEGYADFSSRVRLIHDHVLEKPVNAAKPNGNGSQTETPTGQLDPSKMPFLLYISGNDARRQLLADGGSDVNILVAVNPVDKQILMVNTPRDYYVENPASGNGSRDKLSHCGLNGIENCIGAMTGLYGQEIDYYARINFYGFRTLVDAIGGVTVYSDVAFTAGDYQIYQGENHLNGSQALAFARERKHLPGGDNDRGKNQMKLISAMINQLSGGSLLTRYSEILDSLEGMFATSMSASDLGKLVKLQLSEMPTWEIYSFAVTGDNGNDTCWAVGNGYGYVMYPHEDMVQKASGLIEKVLNGEVIRAEDLEVN